MDAAAAPQWATLAERMTLPEACISKPSFRTRNYINAADFCSTIPGSELARRVVVFLGDGFFSVLAATY
jgi:hypothetical protein